MPGNSWGTEGSAVWVGTGVEVGAGIGVGAEKARVGAIFWIPRGLEDEERVDIAPLFPGECVLVEFFELAKQTKKRNTEISWLKNG